MVVDWGCPQDRSRLQIPTHTVVTASSEHVAVLAAADKFDTLYRKGDFFAEGMETIFGLADGIAKLQSYPFRPANFTPTTANE